MELEDIEYIIERYGVERILEDNRLSWALVLQILDECRYVDLEEYEDDETSDN